MRPDPRERIVRFGAGGGFAGVLSIPRQACHEAPHVVLVNAGIIHRVGPSRLYVDVARTLATQGYPVLRFDLSGLGDSEIVNGGASLTDAAAADIKAALDFLESSRQSKSFILCGLCAGADYSLLASFADPRVVGAILIEPSVARTRRSELIHFGRRLKRPTTWVMLFTLRHPVFRRMLDLVRRAPVVSSEGLAMEPWVQPVQPQPPSPEIRAALARVIDRGVQLMFVFTGGETDFYNYPSQLFDLLPGFDFRQQLRLEYMPETDHVVSDGAGRTKLLKAMERLAGETVSRHGTGRGARMTSTGGTAPRRCCDFGTGSAARRRLFCIPYAGGGAGAFRWWTKDLPDDIELVAVQLPGPGVAAAGASLGRRVRHGAAIQPMIAAVSDLPYAIFGHSMGALVAFELTLALEASGERTCRRLFVSAPGAPTNPITNRRSTRLPKTNSSTNCSVATAPCRTPCGRKPSCWRFCCRRCAQTFGRSNATRRAPPARSAVPCTCTAEPRIGIRAPRAAFGMAARR